MPASFKDILNQYIDALGCTASQLSRYSGSPVLPSAVTVPVSASPPRIHSILNFYARQFLSLLLKTVKAILHSKKLQILFPLLQI